MNHAYPIDRKMLKGSAKNWMRTALPAFWKVALVYLLATTVLSEVVSAFMPGQDLLAQAESYLLNGDTVQAEYLILEIFRSSSGVIFLFVSILLNLYTVVVDYGYVGYTLGVVRGQAPGYGEVFSRFYMAGKIIVAQLLTLLFVFLWSLLFIIPGLIAAYRYQMVTFILLDDPDCPVMEAFRRSKQMMRGRKWERFVLELSFYPWLLLAQVITVLVPGMLSIVAALICNIFLVPYMQFTYSLWYENVRPHPQPAQESSQNPFQS